LSPIGQAVIEEDGELLGFKRMERLARLRPPAMTFLRSL
jgi:hypothetical protein